MLPYFICFAITLVFSAISEYFYVRNNRTVYIFLAILSVLTLSVFAGVRDLNIGVDLAHYIPTFNDAAASGSFSNYLSNESGTEVGYLILNYLISKISTNPNVFLFILGLITYSITYLATIQFRKLSNVTLSLFTFLLLFYGNTFSSLRQSISCALVTLAIGFFMNDKHKKIAIILLIIAPFIHSSAIVGIIILLGFVILKRIKNHKAGKLAVFYGLLGIGVVLATPIANFLVNSGLISNKYSNYLEGSVVQSTQNFTQGVSVASLYRLIFIIAFLLLYKAISKDNKLLFLFSALILDFFTLFLKGTGGMVFIRLGLYATYFLPFAYFVPIKYINNKNLRALTSLVFMVLLVFVFIHIEQGSITGGAENNPYTSSILGIGN